MDLPDALSDLLAEALARVLGRGPLSADVWRRARDAARRRPARRTYLTDDAEELRWTSR